MYVPSGMAGISAAPAPVDPRYWCNMFISWGSIEAATEVVEIVKLGTSSGSEDAEVVTGVEDEEVAVPESVEVGPIFG